VLEQLVPFRIPRSAAPKSKRSAPHFLLLISVIYQGRVTHHLLRRNYVSAPFQVNKLQTMATTLEDLVAGLGESVVEGGADGWPDCANF
jgi:hypothetical protein